MVEHRADDTVVLTVRAFSRPAAWWLRLAGPLGRVVQRVALRRYLWSLDGLLRRPAVS